MNQQQSLLKAIFYEWPIGVYCLKWELAQNLKLNLKAAKYNPLSNCDSLSD